MTKPVVAGNRPKRIPLTKGETYYFCSCGRSDEQPFCNGSHGGTDFRPHIYTADEKKEGVLCVCKHSKTMPFCDGSHKQFSVDQVGKESP